MTNGILTPEELNTLFPEQAISNHPDPNLSSTKRTIQLGDFTFSRVKGNQTIRVTVIVKHYNSDNNYIPNTASDRRVIFDANIYNWVNAETFVRVLADGDGNYPAGSVREWDAWVSLFSSPQQIFNILNAQILAEDQLGRYGIDIYPSGEVIE